MLNFALFRLCFLLRNNSATGEVNKFIKKKSSRFLNNLSSDKQFYYLLLMNKDIY